MTVSNVQGLVDRPSANLAVAEGIANTTGVPSGYVDVDLFADLTRRRLSTRFLSQNGVLIVSYVISVDADAPPSVTVTGADVGRKLAVENIGEIEASISSSVDQSLGAGSFVLSLQKIDAAEVKVRLGDGVVTLGGSSTSSTSIMPGQIQSSTSLMPSSTSTITKQSFTSTTTRYRISAPINEESSGATCNICEAACFAICAVFASLWM